MCTSDNAPTGTCASIVFEKERSLVADLGAALEFKTYHVHQVQEEVNAAGIFYATGFFLTSNSNALFSLLDSAKDRP